ncbi:phosphotransferase [Streptomyces sodiiphilus]|uniref:Phosphotransferase n=1 Tax=Streptomyces sodiiphilus TaxID=226217 RepID=A0ABN2PVP6_9ACTN
MSQPTPAASLRTPPPGPVEGRLNGYHRDWHVLRPEGELAPLGRLKTGGPRPGIHHFDPRCFTVEEDLLIELALLGVPRIAPVYLIGPIGNEIRAHGYIEGEPLSRPHPPGTALTPRQLDQLSELFGRLATVRPAALALLHDCPPGQWPRDSAEFLHWLVRFTRERVWEVHRPVFEGLFTALGIDPGVLAEDGPPARDADRLADRPACLLHGDLHRDNLIVDEAAGDLWTIDWELALLGDPLYDLATHLHLMRYPEAQQRDVLAMWARTVEAALPGASAGMAADLPRYLRYKRVQSVFTDVIRHGLTVLDAPGEELPARLARTAKAIPAVLHSAAGPLRLRRVPSPGDVEAAYAALRAG